VGILQECGDFTWRVSDREEYCDLFDGNWISYEFEKFPYLW